MMMTMGRRKLKVQPVSPRTLRDLAALVTGIQSYLTKGGTEEHARTVAVVLEALRLGLNLSNMMPASEDAIVPVAGRIARTPLAHLEKAATDIFRAPRLHSLAAAEAVVAYREKRRAVLSVPILSITDYRATLTEMVEQYLTVFRKHPSKHGGPLVVEIASCFVYCLKSGIYFDAPEIADAGRLQMDIQSAISDQVLAAIGIRAPWRRAKERKRSAAIDIVNSAMRVIGFPGLESSQAAERMRKSRQKKPEKRQLH